MFVYHLLRKIGWSTVVVNGRVKSRVEISTGMRSFHFHEKESFLACVCVCVWFSGLLHMKNHSQKA